MHAFGAEGINDDGRREEAFGGNGRYGGFSTENSRIVRR
jgi:hypothetical protein